MLARQQLPTWLLPTPSTRLALVNFNEGMLVQQGRSQATKPLIVWNEDGYVTQ